MKKKAETATGNSQGIVRTLPLEEILSDRFARYSKYIIQERALPDARDGLKPVQRRILYAMQESGNTWDKPYHKSAKTVGNVIGNYHPHGDSSVYNAMVRLSQDWKMNFPLIDMQGNNGSIDDDPAAAMRYTEARLAPVTGMLLQDIDKETVEWAPNFSDEKMEPTVLPARYPNLLTMGISGIAAGYATNIPPHNMTEILDGAIELARNPDSKKLYDIVQGPDFPTGGIVMGRDGIRSAFDTGRGRIIIRSKCDIVQGKTVDQIIVTEIPYEVVKSGLVKKIDDIRLNRKAEGILDVRDESDRNGLRIAIDLKKDAPAETILNYLYKNTDLQVSFSYNMIAIVNRRPVLLGLRQAILAFLDHRREVILRRSAFDLKKKQERAHIQEGLIKAISIMDEVIALIRGARDKADAKSRLMEHFAFTAAQAEAIVMMRLYRLSHMDITQLEQEYAQLESEIAELEKILAQPKELDRVLTTELREVRRKFPMPRKSQIVDEVESIVIDPMAMIPDEPAMLAVTRQAYVKRSSLRSYNASGTDLPGLKEGDEVLAAGELRTRDQLLVFTERGRAGIVPVWQLEESRWKDTGMHLSALLKTEPNEQVAAVFVLRQTVEHLQVVQVSAHGQIKRSDIADFTALKPGRLTVSMKLGDLDRLNSVVISRSPEDRLGLMSVQGLGLQYEVQEIPQSGLKTKGVRGLSLVPDDEIAAVHVLDQEPVVILAADGSLKRLKREELPVLRRPAKGQRMFKQVKSRGYTISDMDCLPVHESVELVSGSDHSTIRASEIPLMTAASTFSRHSASLEQGRFLKRLQPLENGTWAADDKESTVQPTLFDEG